MHYNTSAIVLQQRLLGEKSIVVLCITAEHGLVRGLIKRCSSKKIQLIHVGNLLQINRFTREDCLGSISAESQKCYALLNLHDRKKMHLINIICNTVAAFFREGSHVNELSPIFCRMISFFDYLNNDKSSHNSIMAAFIILQKYIITKAGYGFSLSECVANGDNMITNLIYLSPKSASAVSEIAGLKYKHLLLKLPRFFITEELESITDPDIFDGLVIVDHFITRFYSKILTKEVLPSIQNGLRYLKKQYQSPN